MTESKILRLPNPLDALPDAEMVPSVVPKGQIRLVGSILGLSAALIGMTSAFINPDLPGPSVILLIVGLVVTLMTRAGATIIKQRLTIIDAAFGIYLFVRVMVEIYNSTSLDHEIYSQVLFGQLQVYLMTWPPRLVIRNREDLGVFLRAFAWPAAFVALLALAQLLKVPGVQDWVLANVKADGLEARITAGRDDLRATSTIGHWTYLGGYLSCITAMVCVELLSQKNRSRAKTASAGAIVMIGLLLIGQITTLTFATIALAAAVVGITILRMGVRPIVVLVILGSGIVAWTIFGAQVQYRIDYQATTGRYDDPSLSWIPSTVAYRMRIWELETIPSILQRRWTGWGLELYNFDLPWPIRPPLIAWLSPESQWMSTLITGGIISLFAFIFVMIAALVTIFRAKRVLGKALEPVVVLFAGLLIVSGISAHFTAPGVPFAFWALIGSLIPFAQQAKDKSLAELSRKNRFVPTNQPRTHQRSGMGNR